MASVTAQILIGSPHPDHDGIIPTHYLFLSENDRPAWILVGQNVFDEEDTTRHKKVWIPTLEDALEDALLMVALHVMRSPAVLEQAIGYDDRIEWDRVELYADLKQVQRRGLHRVCRTLTDFPKLAVSVFQGSLITAQLPVLEEYAMDVEVCLVAYSRLKSSPAGAIRSDVWPPSVTTPASG
jgi:hypothetical protein